MQGKAKVRRVESYFDWALQRADGGFVGNRHGPHLFATRKNARDYCNAGCRVVRVRVTVDVVE